MSDPRIVDYIRQNSGQYPIETLKAALIKQGYAADAVEAAAAEAVGQAPSPPAPGQAPQAAPPAAQAAETSSAGYTIYSPKTMFTNAKRVFTEPEAFFASLNPQGDIGPALINVVLWAFIAGALYAVVGVALGTNMVAKAAAGAQIILFPIMAMIFSFIGAGIYHVICMVLGGKAPFKGSYQVIAGIAALFPISAAVGMIPFGSVPVQVYGCYLSVASAAGLHKIGKKKAWIVFGILTGLGIIGSISTTIAAKKLQQMAASGELQKIAAEQGFPQQMPGGGFSVPQAPGGGQ